MSSAPAKKQRLNTNIYSSIISMPEKKSFPPPKPLPNLPDYGQNAIEVQNLTFGYGGSAKPVLSDLNLSLPTGSRCLLIGANGRWVIPFASLWRAQHVVVLFRCIHLLTSLMHFFKSPLQLQRQINFAPDPCRSSFDATRSQSPRTQQLSRHEA